MGADWTLNVRRATLDGFLVILGHGHQGLLHHGAGGRPALVVHVYHLGGGHDDAFAAFDVSDKLSVLRSGRNVLAIQGLNDALSSSDMLIIPELHGGRVVPPSTNEPPIAFGTLDVSPASGNQDEEYIQLLNTNDLAVDISGWQLTGGVEHLFPGGTVIPAYGAIYITPSAAAFRA